MSEELSDNYLRNVVRSVGVQPLWIDDCVQEMRLALWQAGEEENPKVVARYTAIDFSRKLSSYSRTKKVAPAVLHFGTIEAETPFDGISYLTGLQAVERPTDDVIDARDAIARLEPREKRLIAGLARGETMKQIGVSEGISEGRVSQLVIRARERLCA